MRRMNDAAHAVYVACLRPGDVRKVVARFSTNKVACVTRGATEAQRHAQNDAEDRYSCISVAAERERRRGSGVARRA